MEKTFERKLQENRYNQLVNKKNLNKNEIFELNLLKKILNKKTI
ncbi:hypothetical protein CPT_Maine_011 [Staphylococcus phage Maine]|nr:hypothetical protein CPT_Maine_011 [Staphylococcus phage Maine]